MNEFNELQSIADRLLGEDGCSWDREQTLQTLQPYLLEESHELLEAIDEKDPAKMAEELGDVFYALIFIAKLGEKESLFTLKEALGLVCQKLIRRHPHVFGDVKVSSNDEIMKNWEAIKKAEGKKNPIEGIAPTLPALARAQKVVHKMMRMDYQKGMEKIAGGIGQKLWDLIWEAEKAGVDAEGELRRVSMAYESEFKKNV